MLGGAGQGSNLRMRFLSWGHNPVPKPLGHLLHVRAFYYFKSLQIPRSYNCNYLGATHPGVGQVGFEPTQSKDSRFTVYPGSPTPALTQKLGHSTAPYLPTLLL